MGKKIVALVLALVMTLSLCTTALAAKSKYTYSLTETPISAKANDQTLSSGVAVCPGTEVTFTISTTRNENKYNNAYPLYAIVYNNGESDETIKEGATSSYSEKSNIYSTTIKQTLSNVGKYTFKVKNDGAENWTSTFTVEVVAHDYQKVVNKSAEGQKKANATCAHGTEYYQACSKCGKVDKTLETFYGEDAKTTHDAPAAGATPVLAAQDPTCCNVGWKAVYQCAACQKFIYNSSKTFSANWVEAAAYAGDTDEAKAAAWKASAAGKIAALGHTTKKTNQFDTRALLTEKNAKDPTCTEPGYKTYYYCNQCEQYYYNAGSDYTPIGTATDLTTWLAEGGDGYTAPIDHKNALTTSNQMSVSCWKSDPKLQYNDCISVKCTDCKKVYAAQLKWDAAKGKAAWIYLYGNQNGKTVTATAEEQQAFFEKYATIGYGIGVTKKAGHDYSVTTPTDYSLAARVAYLTVKSCTPDNGADICNHHQPMLALVEPFTVTFNTNGAAGETPASQPKFYGDKIATPTNPTKSPLLFDGWYNGETKWNFSTDTVTTNTDLIAKYYATVKFDKNGAAGTTPKDLTVDEGSKVTEPTGKLTKTGYNFEGWFYKTGTGKYAKWDFNTAIASNTELDKNGVLTLVVGWTQVKHEATATDFTPGVAGDVKANFTVSGGNYEQLLTEPEKKAIKDEGNSYELILTVETPNASATDVAKELTQLDLERDKNEKLAFQADISLTKIAKDVMGAPIGSPTDITKTDKTIRVTIDVPDDVCKELKAVPDGYRRTINVNRAHTNGDTVAVKQMNNVEFNEQNKTLSFDTNQFSVYEITYVDVKVNHPHAHYIVNSVKTGDSGVLLYGVLAVSSLMGMGYTVKRRKEK